MQGEISVFNVDFAFPVADKRWIKVEKDDIVISFDAETKLLSTEGDLKEGCGIVLIKIRVGGKIAYSLRLEAFSDSGKYLNDNSQEGSAYIFNAIDINRLRLSESFSSPEFIYVLFNFVLALFQQEINFGKIVLL